MKEKLISIELDVVDNPEGVRIITSGWAEEQEIIMSQEEAWNWLCAASNNGHRHVTISVWSNQR